MPCGRPPSVYALRSPILRRIFTFNQGIALPGKTLTDYANAAEAVAEELNLPFIDLHRASIAHHNQIGREESMTYNFKEGDKTHFNKKGAEAITDLLLEELKTVVPELATYLKVAGPAE